MSKVILWFGFILSLIILPFGLFVSNNPRPVVVVFWIVILVGSGYKLFFAPKRA